MKRDVAVSRLDEPKTVWDVVIIGGGATGLGCAVDAASRGYQTLVLEAKDFSQGTSSRSTKLVHGGVRYLRQGNFSLVREALRERAVLLRNAPHCVRRLSFVLPVYSQWEKFYYRLGLGLYDQLAGKLGIDAARLLSAAETLKEVPTLRSRGLQGSIRYMDGQFDDARLAIGLARTAVSHGATVLNYAPVSAFLKTKGQICGVVARDTETGKTYEIQSRVVINATGIFADEVRRLDSPAETPQLAFSQGSHIVLDSSFLPGKSAILVPKTKDGRVLFAIPWHHRTLIGTTDELVPHASSTPIPSPDEIAFLLQHSAEILERAPQASDILSCYAGVRPLLSRVGTQSTSSLSREHALICSGSGLVTITGGKWTTYRTMAEQAVNQAIVIGGLPSKPCSTATLSLGGATALCDFEEVVPAPGPAPADVLHPRLSYREEHVRTAVREEMARTLEDVLARRTRALFLDAWASFEMSSRVAELMAKELGRDKAWVESELHSFRAVAKGYLPARSENPS